MGMRLDRLHIGQARSRTLIPPLVLPIRSPPVCHNLRRPHGIDRSGRSLQLMGLAAGRYDPPVAMSAQAMRAMRLAKATITTCSGLRASIRDNQPSPAVPRVRTHRTTLLAPMTRSRRRSRWPIFEIRPSRSLPPDDACNGTRPIHAAKSRPLRKVDAGGARASIAEAQIGPMPGMVMSLEVNSSAWAWERSRLSSAAVRRAGTRGGAGGAAAEGGVKGGINPTLRLASGKCSYFVFLR